MKLLSVPLLWLIGGYRRWVSPLLPRHCRYEPTCSAYAAEAIREHGPFRGVALSISRVARCHPWASGGIDRVPRRKAV